MKKMTRLVRGVNDLATVNPALAAEFAEDLNAGLTAKDIAAHSRKKVIWRCATKGHVWSATVDSRSKCGCPFCSGKRPVVGETDLATVNPDLAAELVNELNEGITAQDVTAYSHKKLWWKCVRGHMWETTVNKRSYGTECPYCAGKRPIPGETDLATVNPDLAAELADDLNNGITAEQLSEYSNRRVAWRCKKGHVWKTTVCNRSNGTKCPYCSGRRPIAGETDLATVNPTLAAELADDLNDGIMAEHLTAHSERKMMWRCEQGHEWSATVNNRSEGKGCPYCAGRRPIVGETDLATVNPALAAELANDLNNGVTAEQLMAYSDKKLMWRCKEGHVWGATVMDRSYGTGCPYCAKKLPVVGKTDLATVYPGLAAELVDELNDGVTAETVTAHSSKKLFWRCENGHVYRASVNKRSYGRNCPFCAKKTPYSKKHMK